MSSLSLKNMRYLLEAFLALLWMAFFRVLPMDTASWLAGRAMRWIGPFLRAHRIAEANISRVFPEYTPERRKAVLAGMWDNLGRVAGEYPHISIARLSARTEVIGMEHLQAVSDGKAPAVLVTGHFANWEVPIHIVAGQRIRLALVYRAVNNPYVKHILLWLRSDYAAMMHEKREQSVRIMHTTLKGGECLAMLADQRLDEGVMVPFMSAPAMTAISPVYMAIKYQVPLIALHVERTHGAHFRMTVQPPVLYAPQTDPVKAMEELHQLFEKCIRTHPEQWFWVHDRWKQRGRGRNSKRKLLAD